MQKFLDDNKRKQIIGILAVGGTRTLAAQLVGCHPRTIYNEAQADQEFAQKLNHAETCPEYNMLEKLAGCPQAHALKWGLERRYPDRYRPRPPGTFSVDAVKQLLAALAARLSEQAASDEERLRVLSIVAQVGKEVVIHTQPFIAEAVRLMSDLGDLGKGLIRGQSIAEDSSPAASVSGANQPVEEHDHAQ